MELKNETAEEKKQAWIISSNAVDLSPNSNHEAVLFTECVVGTKTKVKEYLQYLLDEDAAAVDEPVIAKIDAQAIHPDGVDAYLLCESEYVDYLAKPIKKARVLK